MSGFVERVIEDWLTKADERGFQLTFASSLARQGHIVKYVSPHGTHEHGKDVVSFSTDRQLHTYQLKAGNINTSQWRAMAEEVREAANLPVDVPGVRTRSADKAFLVLSGRLSDPVRDKLRLVNIDHQQRGYPEIQVIELAELVQSFEKAFESFLPNSVGSFNELVSLYLQDGRGPQDRQVLHSTFQSFFARPLSKKKTVRAMADVVVAAEFAAGPFRREQNHMAVLDTWVMAASSILLQAKERQLALSLWRRPLELCWQAITYSADALLEEAWSREDFLEGDNPLVDSQFIPVRRAIATGYIAAAINSKAIRGEDVQAASARMLKIVEREAPVAFWGESRWNYLLNVVLSLRHTPKGSMLGDGLVLHWLETAFPAKPPFAKDPYWTVENYISQTDDPSALPPKEVLRTSYTAAGAVGFLARRMWRQSLARLWPRVGRFEQARFVPEKISDYLRWLNDDGTIELKKLPLQASWLRLRAEAASQRSSLFEEDEVKLLPFFLCAYPHRVDASLAGELDYRTSPATFRSEWS